ncbi:type II toxin-antitoxin system RelE/ParE family toxin [Hymenobacter segetis]|uniref:Type II toxin-antitoxin system RelE/ParE family toxin n=1 Tax=Hymenobacter segetis TaxID=2025509 RepID=A0ABU9LQM1_9BACT
MSDFKGQIRSLEIYGDEFRTFYNKQNQKIQDRILWTFRLIREIPVVPEKYLKHLTGTVGLYEIRVSAGSDIFRIFCFFDEGRLVIVLNGFQKKTQKTPPNEIERAERLRKQYYEDKAKQAG